MTEETNSVFGNEHQDTQPSVEWTAREALACAYCWSEFSRPLDRVDTPETYWLRIDERVRNDYRRIANNLLLLAIARGQAVAMPPPATWKQEQLNVFMREANLVSTPRRWVLLTAA